MNSVSDFCLIKECISCKFKKIENFNYFCQTNFQKNLKIGVGHLFVANYNIFEWKKNNKKTIVTIVKNFAR